MTGATSAVVPGAVIVGAALIVQALVGVASQRDQLPAQAGRPTATVTVTPQPSSTPEPTPEPKPSPGSGEATAVGVLVAAERPGRTGPDGGMAPAPGGGDEHPPTSPAEECPRGQVLTVNLPVGVLPCGSVVIGGRR